MQFQIGLIQHIVLKNRDMFVTRFSELFMIYKISISFRFKIIEKG